MNTIFALSSAGQTSTHTREVDQRRIRRAVPVAWSAFLTLLVASPWFGAGYLFGTDWPGPRRFDFPTALSSSAPLEITLAAISRVIAGEWTGKLFVLALLFAAALTAYRAAPVEGFVPGAVASVVYLLNPFVFGRLHYGQLSLLAGYCLLPWVAIRFRRLFEDPSPVAALVLAASVALVGVATVHLMLVAGALGSALVVTHVIGADNRIQYLKRLGPNLFLAAIATLVASSYWLVPLTQGRGPIADKFAGFTAGDLSAFAAVADPRLGLLPNLLGLYGFWAEKTGRFASMKVFVPYWPVILGVIIGVASVGVIWVFARRTDPRRAWVAGLLAAAAIALVLEMGISSPLTRDFVTWLDTAVPLYRGMRDAGKWAALLALVYSQLFALGTAVILDWFRALPRPRVGTEWPAAVATGLLIGLPLYYGNGLLFGMHDQIKPSQYPPGWYQADRILAADPHPGRALFLPWHEYMEYSFIQNQNKVVASPGPTFFSIPVVVSANPEVPGTAAPTEPDQVAIAELIAAGPQAQWASVLTALHIKYVLLAREVDWLSYQRLDSQPGLVKVGDYGSIVLYRNDGLAPTLGP